MGGGVGAQQQRLSPLAVKPKGTKIALIMAAKGRMIKRASRVIPSMNASQPLSCIGEKIRAYDSPIQIEGSSRECPGRVASK